MKLSLTLDGASLVAQTVKGLPAMRETQVRFLGWEDPLEKEMSTHSSTLAWRIPVDRGAAESDTTEQLCLSLSLGGVLESLSARLQSCGTRAFTRSQLLVLSPL